MTRTKKVDETVLDEFKGDEKKIVNMVLEDENPNFRANEKFKNKLDAKISEKIRYAKEQKQDTDMLNAIPKKLKWRLYLTGYGYAVCSFLVLFLIGFCTNIFTGTIKVPTKYTHLEQDNAFGILGDGKQLAYSYNENIASNFLYDSVDVDDSYDEDVEVEEALELDNSARTLGKSSFATITTSNGKTQIESNSDEEATDVGGYNIFDRFMYDKTYRFSYKSRQFPKLSKSYPVYRTDGTLISYSTPKQIFKNLKIGGVSLQNFSELEMERFEMSETTENGYTIMFDNHTQKLSFYPNSSWKAGDFQGTLPSKRKIIKAVEKELKLLGVSLKDYGDGEVNVEDFDENMGIIQIFYPFELQGKNVRNADEGKQIGMDIAYDLNLQKIVYINNIDIAKYQISDYSTVEKSVLEEKIEQGGSYFSQGALHEYSTLVMLDDMEIVYLEKITEGGNVYYIPAIKGTISTSLENYMGPKIIFQELI